MAIIAPLVFQDVYEYPLLLILGVVVLAVFRPSSARLLPDLRNWLPAARALAIRFLPYVIAAALLVAFGELKNPLLGGLLLLGLIVVALAATPRLVAIVTPVALVAALLTVSLGDQQSARQLFQGRSFFGVTRVLSDGMVNALYSGTTLHGAQLLGDKSGVPTTYYATTGPLGDVFSDLRQRTQTAAVGTVGLGTGTIAAYAAEGDRLTFFEIDPLMIRIAQDARYFTFLRESAVAPTTIVGDGRLSLAAQPPGSFDLIVLDAFSSDSVPPHMLTREAMETSTRTLRPGAVLAYNVSNRYYSLEPAVAATARSLGLDAVARSYTADNQAIKEFGATSSLWVVVGRPPDVQS